MKNIKKYFRSFDRSLPTEVKEIPSINYETDSLRFLFETYLSEYDSTRRQIELNLQMAERSMEYLVTLIGGIILTTQVFTQIGNQSLEIFRNFPFLLIILASLSLWFPTEHLFKNAHIAILGRYEYEVLAPKIDAIATLLSAHSNATHDYLNWETQKFPFWLRGSLRWEDFRAKSESGLNALIFVGVGVLRYIFLSIPSLLFIFSFFSIKSLELINWQPVDYILFIIYIVIVISIVIGFWLTLELPIDIFKNIRRIFTSNQRNNKM